MDERLKETFEAGWTKYFDGAPSPLVFFYSDHESYARFLEAMSPQTGTSARCIIARIRGAENGQPVAFSRETMGCPGGGRYSGFTKGFRPKFDYFLSCGIPGEMEGERYKKSPDIVAASIRELPEITAPAKYLVFKRWDTVDTSEEPLAVVFFARPDVLAGLFSRRFPGNQVSFL